MCKFGVKYFIWSYGQKRWEKWDELRPFLVIIVQLIELIYLDGLCRERIFYYKKL